MWDSCYPPGPAEDPRMRIHPERNQNLSKASPSDSMEGVHCLVSEVRVGLLDVFGDRN